MVVAPKSERAAISSIDAFAAGLPLFVVLALMVFKPTWAAFTVRGSTPLP